MSFGHRETLRVILDHLGFDPEDWDLLMLVICELVSWGGLMKILWLSGCYSEGFESALSVNAAFDILSKHAYVARISSAFWFDTVPIR